MKSADFSYQELQTHFPESHFYVCSPPELLSWLQSVEGFDIAFGFLYFPEYKAFVGNFCLPENVKNCTSIHDLENQLGFLAFPFDLEKNLGFFIPHQPNLDLKQLGINPRQTSGQPLNPGGEDVYKSIVANGISLIQRNDLQKVVLARSETHDNQGKSLVDWVQFLLKEHGGSNVTLFQLPGQGQWISATPELLLEKHPHSGNMRTMALAGTSGTERVPTWTSKEQEEQALVGEFIKSSLLDLGLELLKETGPNPVSAGKFEHLRTDFIIASNGDHSFFKLAKLLHPTPAVCGTPREKAKEVISNLEGFDRSFYCGYGGLIGTSLSRLVVLLRCGRIWANQINLFAGAGITADSDPDAEWQETTRKMETLKCFLS